MSQQNHLVTVTVAGRTLGIFDTRSGGNTTAEVKKRRSGGLGPMTQRPAQPDYSDVEVTRELQLERDLETLQWLNTGVGRFDMEVADQYLDDDGNPRGTPTIYLGKLNGCTDPEHDANGDDDSILSLTMQCRSKA
jgi:hypothetical protein